MVALVIGIPPAMVANVVRTVVALSINFRFFSATASSNSRISKAEENDNIGEHGHRGTCRVSACLCDLIFDAFAMIEATQFATRSVVVRADDIGARMDSLRLTKWLPSPNSIMITVLRAERPQSVKYSLPVETAVLSPMTWDPPSSGAAYAAALMRGYRTGISISPMILMDSIVSPCSIASTTFIPLITFPKTAWQDTSGLSQDFSCPSTYGSR